MQIRNQNGPLTRPVRQTQLSACGLQKKLISHSHYDDRDDDDNNNNRTSWSSLSIMYPVHTFRMLLDLILSMILWCMFCWYPHFTDEEAKAQNSKATCQGHTASRLLESRCAPSLKQNWRVNTRTVRFSPCLCDHQGLRLLLRGHPPSLFPGPYHYFSAYIS